MPASRSWLSVVGIWLGVLVTFALAVYPDPVLRYIGVSGQNQELIIRIFTGVNAILLVFLGNAGISAIHSTAKAVEPHENKRLESLFPGYAVPYRTLVIYGQFRSGTDSTLQLSIFRQAAILGNLKPIVVRSIRELELEMEKGCTLGVIAQSIFYEDLLPAVRRSGKTFFNVHNAKQRAASGVGLKVDLSFPFGSTDPSCTVFLARKLSEVFSQDTARGLGFSGNWCGTYGIIAIHQADDMSLRGKYYYGGGEIQGTCEVDEVNERLLMRFSWSQRSNTGVVGSANFGEGVFAIPAGYEFFYGYWYNQAAPDTAQIWSGARLSNDLTREIINRGPFSQDFGLSQHSLDDLVH